MTHFYANVCAMLIGFSSFAQTTIYQEDFETASSGTNYITSITEFTDTDEDFFIRTDGSNIGSAYHLNNINNSYYFAAQDIDGEGASLPVTFSTTPVDITGMTSIEFSILIAEDDDGTNESWDNSDYVHISYSIDSQSEQDFLWIEGDESSGTIYNNKPRIDTDFDDIGDGTEITSTFTNFSKSIALSNNSTITFSIEYQLNSGEEDLAIDNIKIINTSALSKKHNEIEHFSMFPNPTSTGYVNFTTKSPYPLNIAIFDLLGKPIFKQTITNKNLNVSGLTTGVYLIKVSQRNSVSTRKLVIK